MCLNLNAYQFKARRYSYESTYMNCQVTTNQKHTSESQKPKPKRKELKHTAKENHQTTKGKTKRSRKEQGRTTKTTGKQGSK